jgi:streptogramin lyase
MKLKAALDAVRMRGPGSRALVALWLCCGMSLATGASPARALPPPGEVEEFPIEVSYHGAWLGNLASGPEGDMWNLKGSTYFGTYYGEIERRTPTGEPMGGIALANNLYPVDIAEGPDRNMWVVEETSGEAVEGVTAPDTIARITPAEEVTYFPIPGSTEPRGEGPVAIRPGPDGNLWFTDLRPNEAGKIFIGSITPQGAITEHPIPAGSSSSLPVASLPIGIAQGPDGNMWFTDHGQNAEGLNLVGSITPGGIVREYPVPTPDSQPTAIALGGDGNMWFTEPGVGKIGRVTPSGQVTEFSAPGVDGEADGIVRGSDGDMWFGEREPVAAFGAISPSGEVRSFSAQFAHGGYPSSVALGPGGEIWFENFQYPPVGGSTFSYLGSFTIPLAPALIGAPSLTGPPVAGQFLTATPGSWSHAPTGILLQWQRCGADGSGCEDIMGETLAQHLLDAGDVGHTIRVLASANNIAGRATAASVRSATIQPAPAPARVQSSPVAVRIPVIGATLTWRFGVEGGYTRLSSLVVHGLPTGAVITVLCDGPGCATGHRAAKGSKRACRGSRCTWRRVAPSSHEAVLTPLLATSRLKARAQIIITVVMPGLVGKDFGFVVRRTRTPSVSVGCRAPGSLTVSAPC